MSLNRLLAATAIVGVSSIAAAAGPFGSTGDLGVGITPMPVHNTCHSDTRTHGGSYPEHHHRQSNCRVVLDDDDDDDEDDCHSSVLRHFLSGYGRIWHRHRRSDCGIQIYEEGDDDPTPGVGGCIQVGPSTICGFGG